MPDSGIASLPPVAGLDVTLTDKVLSVTINRPDSLNWLTIPVITGVADALEQAADDMSGSGGVPTKSSWRSTA
jgi:enoyl-CoA hydratase